MTEKNQAEKNRLHNAPSHLFNGLLRDIVPFHVPNAKEKNIFCVCMRSGDETLGNSSVDSLQDPTI